MKRYNLVVVGVGAVGREMLRILRQRKFPIDKLKVLARSQRKISVEGEKYSVKEINAGEFRGCEIALFAGTEGEKGASLRYAAEAVRQGALVIDNGADFRMNPDVPLIVPEVNPEDIKRHKGIIANPNCSTIQFVAVLAPIRRATKLKRVNVTTFQAVSGAGRKSQEELFRQTKELFNRADSLEEFENLQKDWYREKLAVPLTFTRPVAFNLIPQIGSFGALNYTSEEWKMISETHKIMHNDKVEINATCVRVPVFNCHSESLCIELDRNISASELKEILKDAEGIRVLDDLDEPASPLDSPSQESLRRNYPVPVEVQGEDAVYVGRIRQDPFRENILSLWSVADNLRKGAALNAVQIAELVIK